MKNEMFNDDTISENTRPTKGFSQTDVAGLVRDESNQALLSTNLSALNAHRERIKKLKENQVLPDDINNIKDDVDSLKNDLSDIKGLLKDLLSRSQ